MNIAIRLLEQARTLATLESNRPRQANLRRAVSSAYYAAFHLMVSEYSRLFSDDANVQSALGRTVNHKDITTAARDLTSHPPRLPRALKNVFPTIPSDLVEVARSFPELQEERHDADYDMSLNYTRKEVTAILDKADKLYSDWQKVRLHPAARLFLATFQLKAAWDKDR